MLARARFVQAALDLFRSFGVVGLLQDLEHFACFVQQQLSDASDVDQLLAEQTVDMAESEMLSSQLFVYLSYFYQLIHFYQCVQDLLLILVVLA